MCRLAVFPPRFDRNIAIKTLQDFEGCNVDGTGYAYIKDGEFVIRKWARSLTDVLKTRGNKFLDHLETSDSWTIAHLRAASHGENFRRNTHPFQLNDDWVFMHNGVWSEYYPMKVALSQQVKFRGETDTEVAGQFFSLVGPKRFFHALSGTNSGVFIGLNKNGKLWISKTSGDLESKKMDGQIVLASSFPTGITSKYVKNGWYKFDNDFKVEDKYVDPDDKGFSFKFKSYRFKKKSEYSCPKTVTQYPSLAATYEKSWNYYD